MDLQQQFGNIDVYLFDQLLRGRLARGMKVLDAGCGGGRNLVYLMREGFEVWGVDRDAGLISEVQSIAKQLAPNLPAENFVKCTIESLPFPDGHFDYIICNAVLHFVRDEAQFRAMTAEMARVLAPGGMFFARLMSTTGVEGIIKSVGERRHVLPGGQQVFLVDEAFLLETTSETFRGVLADPLKSTVVHGQRSMTTWVVRGGVR